MKTTKLPIVFNVGFAEFLNFFPSHSVVRKSVIYICGKIFEENNVVVLYLLKWVASGRQLQSVIRLETSQLFDQSAFEEAL